MDFTNCSPNFSHCARAIQKNIYDMLYKQLIMGPEERFGKIRIQGIYEYGGKYGHLGGFNSQIIPLEVDLIQWSP